MEYFSLKKLSLIKVKMLKMVQFGILSMENNEIYIFQILGFSFIHHSENARTGGFFLVSADI